MIGGQEEDRTNRAPCIRHRHSVGAFSSPHSGIDRVCYGTGATQCAHVLPAGRSKAELPALTCVRAWMSTQAKTTCRKNHVAINQLISPQTRVSARRAERNATFLGFHCSVWCIQLQHKRCMVWCQRIHVHQMEEPKELGLICNLFPKR